MEILGQEKAMRGYEQKLIYSIDSRKDEIVGLTQELIRIPTLNSPVSNYRTTCEYLSKRLKESNFVCSLEIAIGFLGDSEKFQLLNFIGHYEGIKPVQ